MPPRKTDDETHYHIVLIDAERNSIRFGPFVGSEIVDAPDTAKLLAWFKQNVDAADNEMIGDGVVAALIGAGLWGGIEVRLRGDDGTDECLTEIPLP